MEYVGLNDTTITGSRSALGPLIMWYGLRKHGNDGLRTLVKQCIAVAQYAVEVFQTRGVKAWRNLNSPIMVFPRPTQALIEQWGLRILRILFVLVM